MHIVAQVIVFLVVLLHFGIMLLELFFWTKPIGRRAFGLSESHAQQTKVLAANQGLYNGFLAAGLLWGLIQGDMGIGVQFFFLGCIVIAGIFGAITSNKKILFIQALPGALGILSLLLARY